jgi:hypothetical protein
MRGVLDECESLERLSERSTITSAKRLAQEAIDLMLLRQASGGKCATTQTK